MLFFFLCSHPQSSFPRWKESICMVQCILLPKFLVECESCTFEVPCLGAVGAALEQLLVQLLHNESQYL